MTKFRITYTPTVLGETPEPEEVEASKHVVEGSWIVFQRLDGVHYVQVLRIPSASVARIDEVK